jgi:hypothetical protein
MPAWGPLWAHFRRAKAVRCITTIRFSSHPQSYVLNQVNKACRQARI